MFLLTDGTVMVQDLGPSSAGTSHWWRLTPDSSGSYVDGTWSQLASLPGGYAPGSYAAAVLPDGRLAIEGGEFDNSAMIESNRGAIYDPLANTWKMISPPNGGTGVWANVGDAPSVVLADGRWMVGDYNSIDDAILDPGTLTWKTTGGSGKLESNAEAGFTLLTSSEVLSVDVIPSACTTRMTEIFDPATLKWSAAGPTPTPLVGCGPREIGPQILMYNGQVFVGGATKATALYNVTSGTWSSGPDFPVVAGKQQDQSDAGAALLPDGKVLLATRTGEVEVNGGVPSHFLLFDGTSFTQVPDYPTSTNGGFLYMLLLPTGQVLHNGWPGGLEIFTDPGSPNPAAAPTITSVPTQLAAGQTYTVDGVQLNGLSDGAAYGDDYQSSTDYPLVQITNDATGTVTYARTSAMANRSIAPGAASCANFRLPSGIVTGLSKLRIVANGIRSAPVQVLVGSGGFNTTTCVPALIAPPVVSGVAAETHLLTSSAGTWKVASRYAYQWQRCESDGTGCSNIPGATTATYQLASADAGGTLRSTVIASNGNNTAALMAASVPTEVVIALPVARTKPRILGKPQIGRRLRATHGAWSGPPTSYAYRWLRCSRRGGGCVSIAGATHAGYRLSKRDAGRRLRIRITATDLAGSARATSVATHVVKAASSRRT